MWKSQNDMDTNPDFCIMCSKMKNLHPKMCTLITSIILFLLFLSASKKTTEKTCVVNSKSVKISKLSKLKAVKFTKIVLVNIKIKRLVICTLKNVNSLMITNTKSVQIWASTLVINSNVYETCQNQAKTHEITKINVKNVKNWSKSVKCQLI